MWLWRDLSLWDIHIFCREHIPPSILYCSPFHSIFDVTFVNCSLFLVHIGYSHRPLWHPIVTGYIAWNFLAKITFKFSLRYSTLLLNSRFGIVGPCIPCAEYLVYFTNTETTVTPSFNKRLSSGGCTFVIICDMWPEDWQRVVVDSLRRKEDNY